MGRSIISSGPSTCCGKRSGWTRDDASLRGLRETPPTPLRRQAPPLCQLKRPVLKVFNAVFAGTEVQTLQSFPPSSLLACMQNTQDAQKISQKNASLSSPEQPSSTVSSYSPLPVPVGNHRTCTTNSTNTTHQSDPSSSSSLRHIQALSEPEYEPSASFRIDHGRTNEPSTVFESGPARSPPSIMRHRSSYPLTQSSDGREHSPSASSPSSSSNGPYSSTASASNASHMNGIPPSSRPSSTQTSSPSSDSMIPIHPDTFLPLLRCPLCDPPALLSSPITLRCGHTVCTKHLTSSPPQSPSLLSHLFSHPRHKPPLPPCPLPTCKSSAPAPASSSSEFLPRHPDSRVGYIPPPPAPSSPPPGPDDNLNNFKEFPLRVDVTVNKVLALLTRSHLWFRDEESDASQSYSIQPYRQDEQTDSEDDNVSFPVDESPEEGDLELHQVFDRDQQSRLTPGSGSGTHVPISEDPPPLPQGILSQHGISSLPSRTDHPRRRPRSPPSSPPVRPRKRPRLNRTFRSLAPQPSGLSGNDSLQARARFSASARLEKELLAELTCEICFGLMWQPLTTPCQHVRLIFLTSSIFHFLSWLFLRE